jgi:hypothetical protein
MPTTRIEMLSPMEINSPTTRLSTSMAFVLQGYRTLKMPGTAALQGNSGNPDRTYKHRPTALKETSDKS